jgi:hypothetical protein
VKRIVDIVLEEKKNGMSYSPSEVIFFVTWLQVVIFLLLGCQLGSPHHRMHFVLSLLIVALCQGK